MEKELVMENVKFGLIVLLVLVLGFLGFDAFFTLVGDLYTLLDGYVWAFFAGFIAFFAAIFIASLMIQITVVGVTLTLVLIGNLLGY